MKLFTGSLAAGLVLFAAGAQAQAPYGSGRAPYAPASDFDAPYAAAPPVGGPYVPAPRYGYGPSLLPSTEVYAVLRDNGFLPLGIPRLRGFVYTIAAIERGGEGGRLVIDARNGRIIRFMPANRMGDNFDEEQSAVRGAPGVPPPAEVSGQVGGPVGGAPRPAPKVASRTTVPVPKAKPVAAKPASEPVQQAAAPSPKAAEAQAAAPQAAVTTGSVPAKPVPKIAPTQDMPKMQGLE